MKSERKLTLFTLVFLAFAATSFNVSAAAPPPLPSAAEEALNKGIIAAKVPDYLLAIRYFEEAGKLAPLAPVIYLNLGIAESKLPSRELRAMAWFGAYLAAYPDAPNAAAVKEQIGVMEVRSKSNLLRLVKFVEDAAMAVQNSKMVTMPPMTYKQNENFRLVAGLWAAAGDMTLALKTADLIQDAKEKSKGQSDIASAQIKAGDLVDALKTLVSAQKSADLIQDAEEKSKAQSAIASEQIKAGDLVGALKTLVSAQKSADLIPDDLHRGQSKSSARSSIAVIQAEAGDITGAQKTVDLIWSTGNDESIALLIRGAHKGMAQRAIVLAQIKSGDIAGAQKTAELIHDGSGHKSSAQARIAEAKAEDGDIAGAQKTADLIQRASTKSWAQRAIAEAQVKAGDIAGAQKTADLIQEAGYKRSAQSAIAVAQAKAGDIAGAQKTADIIQEAHMKSWAQLAIAEAQAKAGDIAGAQKTADLIQNAGWKGQAQLAIAEAQAKAGHSQSPTQRAVPSWLSTLDGSLNYEYFLDLTGYLKSPLRGNSEFAFKELDGRLKILLRSDNPQSMFENLRGIAQSIANAQNSITGMLKQQAKR